MANPDLDDALDDEEAMRGDMCWCTGILTFEYAAFQHLNDTRTPAQLPFIRSLTLALTTPSPSPPWLTVAFYKTSTCGYTALHARCSLCGLKAGAWKAKG